MCRVRKLPRYTYADYVAIETATPIKHEYLDGEIFAMAGGSKDHAALAAEVIRVLGNALQDGPCVVHSSDLRIYVEAVGLATFPDGSVICGTLEQHPPSPEATALNPTVLVEVTNDSSFEYDHSTKLEAYLTIPSLRDYVIVSHRERRITVHHRVSDGSWRSRVAITGGRVAVESAGAELVVDDVYRRTSVR
jgi:Uma2 family endonuclease